MASAKFLEEALSNDVDESAVSALVGSLENQLVTSATVPQNQTTSTDPINQNHVNSAISNGGQTQKHGTLANGESECAVVTTATANDKVIVNNTLSGTLISGAAAQVAASAIQQNSNSNTNYITQQNSNNSSEQPKEGVKIVYSQGGQAMTTTGTIISNRVTFPTQNLPNGTIGITPQTVLQTNTSNVQAKQPTLVIKTSAAPGATPGIVTLPMNVAATVPQVNNVGSPTTQTPTVLSNLQVVNVRPGIPAQPQKGQTARVVLSAPQIVGARPGAPVSCAIYSY